MEIETNPAAEGIEVDNDDLLLCGEGDFVVDGNMEIEESLGEETEEEEELWEEGVTGGVETEQKGGKVKGGEGKEQGVRGGKQGQTGAGAGAGAEVLGGEGEGEEEGEEEEGDDKQLPQCHHLQLVRHKNSTVE